jgi:hypothetical protein
MRPATKKNKKKDSVGPSHIIPFGLASNGKVKEILVPTTPLGGLIIVMSFKIRKLTAWPEAMQWK